MKIQETKEVRVGLRYFLSPNILIEDPECRDPDSPSFVGIGGSAGCLVASGSHFMFVVVIWLWLRCRFRCELAVELLPMWCCLLLCDLVWCTEAWVLPSSDLEVVYCRSDCCRWSLSCRTTPIACWLFSKVSLNWLYRVWLRRKILESLEEVWKGKGRRGGRKGNI